jgi:hypothetical protein
MLYSLNPTYKQREKESKMALQFELIKVKRNMVLPLNQTLVGLDKKPIQQENHLLKANTLFPDLS